MSVIRVRNQINGLVRDVDERWLNNPEFRATNTPVEPEAKPYDPNFFHSDLIRITEPEPDALPFEVDSDDENPGIPGKENE